MRPLRCLLGRHKWRTQYTGDRRPYIACARCHRDGPVSRRETNAEPPDQKMQGLGGISM
jgi:hypothetical protein